MKANHFLFSFVLTIFASSAFAENCSLTIAGNDAMQFDKKSLTVSKSCKEFTINLTHSGKLPRNVMGHNWVLTKAADANPVASEGMAAGLPNEYLKPDDKRIIAFTKIIGGGENTSVTFPVNKLNEKETYTFFCSFPGHVSIMQGSLTLVP